MSTQTVEVDHSPSYPEDWTSNPPKEEKIRLGHDLDFCLARKFCNMTSRYPDTSFFLFFQGKQVPATLLDMLALGASRNSTITILVKGRFSEEGMKSAREVLETLE